MEQADTPAGSRPPDVSDGALDPGAYEAPLARLCSVAYARFSRDGHLLRANPRFLALTGDDAGAVTLPRVVVDGQRRRVRQLLQDRETPDAPLLLHFTRNDLMPTTLTTTLAWDGDELVLVGETPVAELEAAHEALVRLNQRVSVLARENVKKSAQLERALAELKEAQATLVHREKMAALGQLSAGVAHELNSPLGYVKSNVYVLRQTVDDLLGLVNLFGDGLEALEATEPELVERIMEHVEGMDLPRVAVRAPELVASIDDGIDRAIDLVRALGAFSRRDELEADVVDLNESLRLVVEFARYRMQELRIDFELSLGEVPPYHCSAAQLGQAVMNLLLNAVQAAGSGGHVGLSTFVAGDEVRIVVDDDGPGIPAAIGDRVFEPFFTTRPAGEGTGLGLSIALGIVQSHRGRITLEERAGGGSVFTIHLPLGSEDSLDRS